MSMKKHVKRLMLLPVLAAGLSVSPLVSKGATTVSTPAKKKPASSSSIRKTGGKISAKSPKRSRKDLGQKAPTTERVSEIQQALAKDGSYSGTPNGQWDGSTVDAMRKFQSTHGLNRQVGWMPRRCRGLAWVRRRQALRRRACVRFVGKRIAKSEAHLATRE